MIIKLCAKCGKIVEYPNRYCTKCKQIVEKETEERQKLYNKKYNKKRDPKLVKFRKSKEWKQLKERYLQDLQKKYNSVIYSYKCEDCIEEYKKDKQYIMELAEEVHHLVPIETPEGWKRRLDYYNLRALCHGHHDYRHNRFQKRKGESKYARKG